MIATIRKLIRTWRAARDLSSVPGWASAGRREAQARSEHRMVSEHTTEKQRALHEALKGRKKMRILYASFSIASWIGISLAGVSSVIVLYEASLPLAVMTSLAYVISISEVIKTHTLEYKGMKEPRQ
jgi:hypothetical protein